MAPESQASPFGASSVAAELARAGITVLALRPPLAVASSDGVAWGPEQHVLVPRRLGRRARRVLDDADWRFEVGAHGVWRFARRVSYGWDDGRTVHLHWGLPASPLTSSALRRLESILWSRAVIGPDGVLEPDPESWMLLAMVEAARPTAGPRRDERLRAAMALPADPGTVHRLAAQAGVVATVRRLLPVVGPAPGSAAAVGASALLRDWVWAASRLLRRRAPRRVRAVLAGTPLLGRSIRRCRFSDIEVLVGRGVFRPMEVSENLVTATLERLPQRGGAVVVEAGTGCGAVALAVAHRRPELTIHATDLSRPAIRWARVNRRRLGAGNVRFHRGSLLQPLPGSLARGVAVVVANVPYVPSNLRRPDWDDTPGAIEGRGDDGLGLPKDLARQALAFLQPGGCLVLQVGVDQWPVLAADLASLGYLPRGILARTGSNVVAWAEAPSAPQVADRADPAGNSGTVCSRADTVRPRRRGPASTT